MGMWDVYCCVCHGPFTRDSEVDIPNTEWLERVKIKGVRAICSYDNYGNFVDKKGTVHREGEEGPLTHEIMHLSCWELCDKKFLIQTYPASTAAKKFTGGQIWEWEEMTKKDFYLVQDPEKSAKNKKRISHAIENATRGKKTVAKKTTGKKPAAKKTSQKKTVKKATAKRPDQKKNAQAKNQALAKKTAKNVVDQMKKKPQKKTAKKPVQKKTSAKKTTKKEPPKGKMAFNWDDDREAYIGGPEKTPYLADDKDRVYARASGKKIREITDAEKERLQKMGVKVAPPVKDIEAKKKRIAAAHVDEEENCSGTDSSDGELCTNSDCNTCYVNSDDSDYSDFLETDPDASDSDPDDEEEEDSDSDSD